MRKSEIKRAIEQINWTFIGVLNMIEHPNDILQEHLEMLGDETEKALNLVIALCDYMIDDGETDLTEDLQTIHDEAAEITGGKYGRISEDANTDERYPLFSRVLINIANMWVEIQHYWDWMEETNRTEQTPATQTPQVEASQTMQPDTPPAAGQIGEAGQEPETDTPPPLPTDLPSEILPPVLDTLKARRIFGKAIEKGYMEKYPNADYFRWIGVSDRGRNVQLAYLCGKIYGYDYSEKHHGNVGKQFPEAELKELFDIDNLQQSLFNFYDRPATKRQKWLDSIDALFE